MAKVAQCAFADASALIAEAKAMAVQTVDGGLTVIRVATPRGLAIVAWSAVSGRQGRVTVGGTAAYTSRTVCQASGAASADRSVASNAPAANAPAFAWPVSGRVISDFGATNSGGKNDGINIATTMGAPIHASASGTVTYAGDELKGYGNLLLLKHAGGYTTAYAHAERLVVQKGDFVARGQVIGYSGQTGDVNSPQLHFEIRSATTPVNPRTYLSSTTASNQANF